MANPQQNTYSLKEIGKTPSKDIYHKLVDDVKLANLLNALHNDKPNTKTSFRSKLGETIVLALAFIMHLPFLLALKIAHLFNIRIITRARNRILYHPCCSSENTDELNVTSFVAFWEPVDIQNEAEGSIYKDKLLRELRLAKQKNDKASWIRFDQEARETYTSRFQRRMRICFECIAEEEIYHNEYVFHLILRLVQHAFLYNRCDFVCTALELHEKYHKGGYHIFFEIFINQPFSVLHLAVVNSHRAMLNDVISIIDHDTRYAMLNKKCKAPPELLSIAKTPQVCIDLCITRTSI